MNRDGLRGGRGWVGLGFPRLFFFLFFGSNSRGGVSLCAREAKFGRATIKFLMLLAGLDGSGTSRREFQVSQTKIWRGALFGRT